VHDDDGLDYDALRSLAERASAYLQHLPRCGLGDPIPDPTTPGVAISGYAEGCTCGLMKLMRMWGPWVWGDEWPP
jgi:hypothetical protein